MFICNHCPYVKAISKEISKTAVELKKYKINVAAIMSNDFLNYPDDSFENMKILARNNFIFPYLIDESQEVQNYGAVCTPDFFGYNTNNELQYRGRLRQLKDLKPVINSKNELLEAMIEISKTGDGPKSSIQAWDAILNGNKMIVVTTRNFLPEIGGMQILMSDLAKHLSKFYKAKVYAELAKVLINLMTFKIMKLLELKV